MLHTKTLKKKILNIMTLQIINNRPENRQQKDVYNFNHNTSTKKIYLIKYKS